jgi:hypothetical protein
VPTFVREFATSTLIADTAALKSGSASDDTRFQSRRRRSHRCSRSGTDLTTHIRRSCSRRRSPTITIVQPTQLVSGCDALLSTADDLAA